MATKLTEKQAAFLDTIYTEGGWMSRKHIATYHSVSVADALVKKGLLELTDTRNYKVTDAGRTKIRSIYALAAIAPPPETADAWTPAEIRRDDEWVAKLDPEHDDDDARYLGVGLPTGGVWTPAVGQRVRVKQSAEYPVQSNIRISIRNSRAVGTVVRYDHKAHGWRVDFGAALPLVWAADELEPAANADAVNAARPRLGDTLPQTIEDWKSLYTQERRTRENLAQQVNDGGDEYRELKQSTDAEIARLRRERDAALSERDALQSFAENVGKTIDEMWGSLRPNSDAITRKNAFSNALEVITAHLEAINLSPATVPPASTDAAMIAALRDRDTGQRTAAGDVLGDVLA